MIEIRHGEALDMLRAIPDASIDAVITDPPYSSGGQFRGDRSISAISKYVRGDSARRSLIDFGGDSRDQRSFAHWCALWLSECFRVAKPGAPIVQFTDWRQLPSTTDAVQSGGWVWRGTGVWAKANPRPAMGRFTAAAEFFVWGSKGAMPARVDVGCLSGLVSTGKVSREDRAAHVTAKPTEVMRAIVKICPPGGLILDPFAGSGSTLVAAAMEGRRAIGIEREPAYVEIARQRIAHALGEKAA